jgi:hypothetical protein
LPLPRFVFPAAFGASVVAARAALRATQSFIDTTDAGFAAGAAVFFGAFREDDVFGTALATDFFTLAGFFATTRGAATTGSRLLATGAAAAMVRRAGFFAAFFLAAGRCLGAA